MHIQVHLYQQLHTAVGINELVLYDFIGLLCFQQQIFLIVLYILYITVSNIIFWNNFHIKEIVA
jgi:hypothetical protein